MDYIALEILHEALVSIVSEMRVTLSRTAFSSVIYEGQDFSCALLDAGGRFVAQSGDDAPIHVVPLARQTEEVVGYFGGDLRPGDVLLGNDPYTSGTHLNDVAMISPVFVGDRLVMLSCTRAHWGDVGGMTPGSLSGRTTEIFQEGIRIPLMKVYSQGKPNNEALGLLFANVRQPRDRRGDFAAMLATKNIAEERLRELVDRFGVEQIEEGVGQIMQRTEMRLRGRIEELPDGDYWAEDYVDSDGHSPESVRIRVRVTVRGSDLEVDLTGSGAQCMGPINASSAVAACAVFVTLKALLDPSSHFNHGTFRPVRVITPEGTVVNASYPRPTGGFVEVYRRISGAVFQALAKAIPTLVPGDSKGSANHVYVSCIDRSGVASILYEYPAGGTGGFSEGDGSNGVREWGSGDFASIQSAEFVEHNHPLLIERCELRPDSCGAGRFRGGLGIRREISVEGERGVLSVLADRNLFPPFGVLGGRAGAPNRFYVRRDGCPVEPSPSPGKVSGFPLQRGDKVIVMTAGGGGYGDPLDRDPDLVQRDVDENFISEAVAADQYGVVCDGGSIDAKRTAERRSDIRKRRISLRVGAREANVASEGAVQTLCLHPVTASALDLRPGDLVEVETGLGSNTRGHVVVAEDCGAGVLGLAPLSRKILGVSDGDAVSVHVLRTGLLL